MSVDHSRSDSGSPECRRRSACDVTTWGRGLEGMPLKAQSHGWTLRVSEKHEVLSKTRFKIKELEPKMAARSKKTTKEDLQVTLIHEVKV